MTIHAPTLAAVRALHPHAAIIRPIGPGQYEVFARAGDAIGHGSAQVREDRA